MAGVRNADRFFFLLIGLLFGVLFASFLEFTPSVLVFGVFLACAVGIAARRTKNPRAIALTFLALGMTAGILRGHFFDWRAREDTYAPPAALQTIRMRFEGALSRALPEPQSSFASGILLGRSPRFPRELSEMLARTSTIHLVAVSGYNITIVAAATLSSLAVLGVPAAAAWWLSVATVILFTLLVGAPASAVRAAIMGILLLFGRRVGRESPKRLALTVAAAGMVLVQPSLLRFDLGFQLSFLAAIGLFWLSPIVAKTIFRGRKFAGIAGIISDTLGAQIMVAPWLLYVFGRLTLTGSIANFVALPVMPFAMFWSFLTGLGQLAGRAASIVAGPIANETLAFVLATVRIADRLPFSAISVERVPWLLILLLYAGLGAVMLFFHRKYAA